MAHKPVDADIENAVKNRDIAGLKRLLDEGLDPNWAGAGGNTLLHAAARLGDAGLVDQLTGRGALTKVFNAVMETPWDVAVAWGHDAAAEKILARQNAETSAPPDALPFLSLEELRGKSKETGIDQFHLLCQKGQLAQILSLAANDPLGLRAQDLLARGTDGDSALMKICQRGQLLLLAKPELWVKRPQEFQALWEKVPKHYRKEVDYDAFVSELRQMKLKSYGNFKLKGFKK